MCLFFFFTGLKDQIRKVCAEEYLVCGEGDEQGGAWQEKVIRSFLIILLIMLVDNDMHARDFLSYSPGAHILMLKICTSCILRK